MKKNKLFLSLLLPLCAVTAVTFAQEIPKDPEVRVGKLSNGLTYYIRHNELPKGRADFYLAQKVGSVLEQENQRGLAHFLEHMAFSGSEHFPGNSMVTELEKKGIRFGANLNASTSFDETVYKLMDIPLTRPGITDTALLVLHDWSGFLTLDDAGIKEQRGIVQEEWRLSAGGGLRILQNDIFPVIYAGTPYANRLPIGLMDVVQNFKRQELVDYYKKWYRPDLQGVIIVGDIDVNEIEAKIKKLFGDIPAPVNPAPRLYAKIPDNKEPIVAYGIDKEYPGITYNGFWKMAPVPLAEKSKLSWYKKDQINQVISSLLMSRFGEITQQADAPFTSAAIYSDHFFIANLQPAWSLSLQPIQKNMAFEAFKRVFMEIERMHRYGFTQSELDEQRTGTLTALEKDYTDRANTDDRALVQEYVNNFLSNDPAPGAEWEYQNGKKFINELSLDTLNYYAKTAMGDENRVIYAMAPSLENLPTKQDLARAWDEAKAAPLQPYKYKTVSTQLLEKPPVPGKIIKTEKGPYGIIEWTLSNGAKVCFKQTSYKEDKLLMSAFSLGGYSQVNDHDILSGQQTALARMGGSGRFNRTDLAKVLTGKDVVFLADVNEFYETISSASSLKDRESLFQLAYLTMTDPRKDQEQFDAYKKTNKEAIKDNYNSPNWVFADSVQFIMNNHHPRVFDWNRDTSLFNKLDYDKILQVYKERFGNAGDFTFFITGNIAADSVKNLVENYLGALPTTGIKEQPKDYGIYPPKGLVKRHFTHAMATPSSSVNVSYTGFDMPYSLENTTLMSYLGRILTIDLTETMRQEQNGVYYVSASGWIDKYPKPHFTFTVAYGTDPDPVKRAALMKTMYNGIAELVKNGPTQETLNKAKSNELKQLREWSDKKDARYWDFTVSHLFITGIDDLQHEKFASSVTPEMIRAFAKRVFSTGNRIEIEMDPEKK